MDERYTPRGDDEVALAREVVANLLPGFDADQLIRAILAGELAQTETPAAASRYNSDDELAQRELGRARAQIALGESARTLQHAFNNPLTALLAEAQLLELDPLGDEQRNAVRRILELTRRLVALSRRLGVADGPKPGV